MIPEIERALGPLVAAGALAIATILLTALVALATRHARLLGEITAERQRAGGRSGPAPAGVRDEQKSASVRHVFLRSPVPFYLLAAVLAGGTWLMGWAIAPNESRFLASREWHVQPFYLATHLIVLRLFMALFVRKYSAGAAQLDIPPDQITVGIRRVVGSSRALLALAIAVPFCALDYRYLTSDGYDKLSEDQALKAVDYLMFGIWCSEWVLTAMIWVTLAGFLYLSYRALRLFRFRAPIAAVVQDKLYRPFLQMSSQGATVALSFACVTGFYIWYAGGAVSDFLGLAVIGALLVVGFVPSWLLLNAKVKRMVREEVDALRRGVSIPLYPDSGVIESDAKVRGVDERLDEVLALMRAWHLERLQLDLGRHEAQSLAVKLAAPAATAGWQFYNNIQNVLAAARRTIGSILQAFSGTVF